jgi:hypothetical protein
MKTIYRNAIALLVVPGMLLVGCAAPIGDESATEIAAVTTSAIDAESHGGLLGTWEYQDPGLPGHAVLTLKADGSLTMLSEVEGQMRTMPGTYTVKSDVLALDFVSDDGSVDRAELPFVRRGDMLVTAAARNTDHGDTAVAGTYKSIVSTPLCTATLAKNVRCHDLRSDWDVSADMSVSRTDHDKGVVHGTLTAFAPGRFDLHEEGRKSTQAVGVVDGFIGIVFTKM